jgi:hypothetical protein
MIPVLGIMTKSDDSPFWGLRQQMNISAGSESKRSRLSTFVQGISPPSGRGAQGSRTDTTRGLRKDGEEYFFHIEVRAGRASRGLRRTPKTRENLS